MRDFAEFIVVVLFIVGLFFVLPLLGAAFGAFAGWVVGWFFDETILGTLARFGVNIEGLAMWQLGCTLGFVGAFFKSSLTNNKKD